MSVLRIVVVLRCFGEKLAWRRERFLLHVPANADPCTGRNRTPRTTKHHTIHERLSLHRPYSPSSRRPSAMGIPHLITHLRPFATSVTLTGQCVVIDGPGLAYHIYHLCLASQPRLRNPFETIPSPSTLAETVLRWLNELRANNATMYCL
jgi:hypothetical protein